MADERDDEPGHEGPDRPSHLRRPTYRTEAPAPGGHTVHDQKGQPRSTPDPRFRDAPITDAERKALYDARNLDEACKVLGGMLEDRVRDGRLPPPVPAADKPVPQINRYMSVNEQIAKGLRPTAEQLAFLQAAPNQAVAQIRTTEFLETRQAQNRELFRRSRRWGAELQSQALRDAPHPEAERQRGLGGIQAWRADIAGAAYRPGAHRTATQGRPPSLDPRFEDAPITQTEIKALKEAKTPEAVAELLSRFQDARVKDGRLPEPSGSHHENSLIGQVFTPDELKRLGLTPTARDLAYLQASASDGWERECTLEFIEHRQAQNARWHLDAQYAARQQDTLARDNVSSYWYEQVLDSRSAERDARTEKGERRTDLQQLRDQAAQRREGGLRTDGHPGQQREGREAGGRGR